MEKCKGESFVQSQLFGGQGEVRVWDLLRSRRVGRFTAVLACELAPKASVGKHQQQEYDELVVVTSGSGRALVNDVSQALEVGTVVTLPRGATLALDNLGDSALCYLIVKAEAQ